MTLSSRGDVMARGVLVSLMGRGAGVVAGAGVSVALGRHYGVEAFGVWSVAIVYSTMVITVLEGGLSRILARETSRNPEDAGSVLGAVLRIRLLLSAVVVPVSLAVAWYANPSFEAWILAVLLVLARQSEALASSFTSVLYVFDRYGLPNALDIARRILVFGGTLICVFADLPIQWVGFLFLAAAVVFAVPLFVATRRIGVKANFFAKLSTPPRDAFWFWLGGVLFWVNGEVDQLMLGALSGNEEVGVYSAAARIVGLLMVIPAALNNVVMPRLFRTAKSGEGLAFYLRGSVLLLGVVGWLSCVEIGLAGEDIVLLMFGDDFAETANVLLVLALFVGIDFLRIAPSWYLSASDRVAMGTGFLVVGAVANIVLNRMLIPLLGAEGAAWATVGSSLVIWALVTFSVVWIRGPAVVYVMLGSVLPAVFVGGAHWALLCLGVSSYLALGLVGGGCAVGVFAVVQLVRSYGVPQWLRYEALHQSK